MDQQRFMAVLSEVAAVGQGGLQINEPGTSRSLKTLPGSWSDLALACLIHVCPASTPLAGSRQPSWPVMAPRLSPATTWGRRHEK
jgi:hypothetical protein